MRLNNLRLPGEQAAIDIVLLQEKIAAVLPHGEGDTHRGNGDANGSGEGIDLGGALVFPGLINSHEHLDFNLFPRLGNGPYTNYRRWGPDIHANHASAIRAVLKVPQSLRTRWGLYKNLLNGFTTVVNHGERLPVDDTLIRVFQDCRCLHSVGFEKGWILRLNMPLTGGRPVVLHVGEGTDAIAKREIDRLIGWNLLHRPLIGIHGVAMTEKQAQSFRALIWCPTSNYFLLNATANVARLKEKVPILFGTDSTLTASWNAWDQLRQARASGEATDRELLSMVTTAPAKTWRLPMRATITVGERADLVIASPRPGMQGMDAFFGLDPERLLLVLRDGRPLLFDESLHRPLSSSAVARNPDDFYPIANGSKYVWGDLPGLMKEIRRYYPQAVFPPMLH
jgi:cytosine/adenosine deaminase-related metal-dependent hydrolase